MSRMTAIISAAVICLIACLGWLANEYQHERGRANTAEDKANSAQAITGNVLTAISIFNSIAGANQHAKEQIALDASGAASDIKVAVANDDCANRPVPAGAVKRLQQYKDSLRQGSGSTVAGQPDD